MSGRTTVGTDACRCGSRARTRARWARPVKTRLGMEVRSRRWAATSQSIRGRWAHRLSPAWPGSSAQPRVVGQARARHRSRAPARRPSRGPAAWARKSRSRDAWTPALVGPAARRLQADQAGGGAADPAVAGGRVVLEDQPARRRAGELAGVPVGQERPVRRAGEPDRGGVAVVDRPADVVVAAQVGDPGARGRRRRQGPQRVRRQPRVAGGQHRPDLHHEAVVVGEVADLAVVLTLPEVVHQVVRPDDRLGLERDCGAGDPGHRAQRLGDGVDLGLVLAVGAQPLPHERDRVQPQHLHAGVGQEEHDLGVLEQHLGVGPVDVPLEGVERRPHPAVQVVVPGEAAGGEVREDLGQGPLVGVGQLAVGEDVEVRRGSARCPRAPPAPTRARGRRG